MSTIVDPETEVESDIEDEPVISQYSSSSSAPQEDDGSEKLLISTIFTSSDEETENAGSKTDSLWILLEGESSVMPYYQKRKLSHNILQQLAIKRKNEEEHLIIGNTKPFARKILGISNSLNVNETTATEQRTDNETLVNPSNNRLKWFQIQKNDAKVTYYQTTDDIIITENFSSDSEQDNLSQTIEPLSQCSVDNETQNPVSLNLSATKTQNNTVLCTPQLLLEKSNSSKMLKRSGKFMQELKSTIKFANMTQKFLEVDRNIGLRSGLQFYILELKESFGVHLAVTSLKDHVEMDHQTFYIILTPKIAANVKVGSILEAFFDSDIKPYTIQIGNGSKNRTYVQPQQVLLL